MIEVKVPQLAESINEGTIVKWLKEVGEPVEAGDILLELETDKVNLEINADESGVLQERLKEEGDSVSVGEVIARLSPGEGTESTAPASSEQSPTGHDTAVQSSSQVEAVRQETVSPEVNQRGVRSYDPYQLGSPAARRRALRQGTAPPTLSSGMMQTAPGGGRAGQGQQVVGPQQVQGTLQGDLVGTLAEMVQEAKPIERVRMSRRRQTIAKRLVEAQQTAAMLTTFNEVDMSAIIRLRNKRKEDFHKEHGVKLGFMSFFTKAVIGALRQFPLLNAEIDGDEILIKHFYDIGIAVSTDEGLVVPVVRDADKLSFAQIEQEIAALAEKARDNKLTLQDLQGGTFTITNGGIFGSLLSTPILNPPQVGILGMHTIQMRPVAIDEERQENRPMMYIALSYDHRIVDGKEAVSFLVKVKTLLEDPESLLLEG